MEESTTKGKRGGARPNSGRRPRLEGKSVRKDLRLPESIEIAAIKVGKGSFSDGARLMIDEWLKYRERQLPAEKPVLGNPVMAWIAADKRWAIATPEKDKHGHIIFREKCAQCGQDALLTAERWRILPPPEDGSAPQGESKE